MATDGFFQLGEALLGGGVDRQGAYLEGLDAGSQIQHRRAQTTNALAQARQRQQVAEAREKAGDAAEAAGLPRELGTLLVGEMGGEFKDVMSGLETQQGMGFAQRLADPTLPAEVRQGAGLALRREPVVSGDVFGPGGELTLDVFGGALPESAATTPTGQAQIGADQALATERLADAALADEKRTNPAAFRSGGVTLNVGSDGQGLGDVLLEESLASPTTMPEEGNVPAATGISGFLGAGANTLGDVLEIGIPFPNLERARNALRDLYTRTQIVSQQAVPGRPSNYLMQQLSAFGVEPGTLTRGDEGSLQRLEQTSRYLSGEVDRLRTLVNRGPDGGLTSGDLSDASMALQDLARLKRDYDVVIDKLRRSIQAPSNVAADGAAPDEDGWVTTPSGVRYRAKPQTE